MVLTAVLQVSTVLVAVLTLVWHQSRTIDGLREEAHSDHRHLMKLQAKATRQNRKDNEKLRAEFTSSQDKLRAEFTSSQDKLRAEFTASQDKLRTEFTSSQDKLHAKFTSSHDKLETSHNKLWDVVIENGRKLDRVEGFLGLGMRELAAERAAGSVFGPTRPGLEDQSEEPQAGADEDD